MYNRTAFAPEFVAACILVLLGVAVLAGWYSHTPLLIQIHPSYVPMQFNTALGFLLVGAGLIALYQKQLRFALVTAVAVLTLGGVTLVQYVLGIDVGLDQLFMQHYIDVHTPNPGRMAPNTALCFSLSGITLGLLVCFRQRPRFLLAATALSALIAGLGLIALFGYVTNLVPTFGWGSMTRMAVHTSFGFLVTGISLLLFLRRSIDRRVRHRQWVYVCSVPLLFTVLACLYFSVAAEREKQLKRTLEQEATLLAGQLQTQFSRLATAQSRIVDRWLALPGGTEEGLWRKDARAYIQDFPIYDALVWIGTDQNIRWQELREQDSSGEVSDFTEHKGWKDALAAAENHRSMYTGIFVTADRAKGRVLLISKIRRQGMLEGWIVGILNQNTVIHTLNRALKDASIQIERVDVSAQPFYMCDSFPSDFPYKITKSFVIGEQQWAATVHGTERFSQRQYGPIQRVVFVISFLLCAVLIWMVNALLTLREQRDVIDRILKRQIKTTNVMIDGLVVANHDGEIVEVNDALLTMFGYPRDEVLGNSVSMLLPDALAKNHDAKMKHYNDQRKSAIVGQKNLFSAVKKDGTEFPIQLQVTTYGEGIERVFIGVVDDLSQLHENKNKLAEIEAIHRVAFNSSSTGFVVGDINKRFIDVNQAFSNWIGYTREELLSMGVEQIALDQDKPDMHAELDKMIAGELDETHREKRFVRKDGQIVWGLVSASVIRGGDGNVIYVAAQIADVSKLKQLETSLEQQNTALISANEELEQFAYAASHDLKEPVRTLKTFSTYLIEDLEAGNQERVAQDKAFIDGACRRMSDLIDGLLSLSRAGNSEITIVPCDLNVLCNEVVERLHSQIEETQAKIVIAPNLPTIGADETFLGLVFQNIINNAIKFRKKDTVAEVNISAKISHGEVSITIADNGIGIPPSKINTIFGVFKKLHSISEYEGTGIGLAIVKKIIERHEGTIDVYSNEGEGTAFVIRLPTLSEK